jgi:hypothetical protein
MMAMASTGWALNLGTDITIYDNYSSGTGWYGPQEDQETEPGTVQGSAWDLEGMYLSNGDDLTLVGQYDFQNGVNYNNQNIASGDIFIDVNGDAVYGGPANGTGVGNNVMTSNLMGYEYVLDLDFNTMTYDVYALGAGSKLYKVSDIDEGNPWRYAQGGTAVQGYQDVAFSYYTGLTSAQVGGLVGASHNAVVVDLSFLPDATVFTAHYTYGCGNDNLMGRARVPDAASTVIMLGLALTAIGMIRRSR